MLTFSKDHGSAQVLDRLLDDIVQDPHHSDGLFFAKPFILEPLDEFQSVEVMLTAPSWSCMERAPSWIEYCNIYAIVSDRIAERFW